MYFIECLVIDEAQGNLRTIREQEKDVFYYFLGESEIFSESVELTSIGSLDGKFIKLAYHYKILVINILLLLF